MLPHFSGHKSALLTGVNYCTDDNISHTCRQQETAFDNPTYDATSFTPTQYSSHGPEAPPADTSATVETSATNATVNKKTSKKQTRSVGNENPLPVTGGEYNVLEDKGGEGGGGDDVVYQMLEGPGVATYEIPVPEKASSPANQAANNQTTNSVTQDEEYSTLKYN